MNHAQLELSLHGRRVYPPSRHSRHPSAFNSRWWFQRMRQVVDRAFDWQPAPPPRPEQIWFRGTHREIRVGS